MSAATDEALTDKALAKIVRLEAENERIQALLWRWDEVACALASLAADTRASLLAAPTPATPSQRDEVDPYCELAASEIPGFGTNRDKHRCPKLHRDKPLPPEVAEMPCPSCARPPDKGEDEMTYAREKANELWQIEDGEWQVVPDDIEAAIKEVIADTLRAAAALVRAQQHATMLPTTNPWEHSARILDARAVDLAIDQYRAATPSPTPREGPLHDDCPACDAMSHVHPQPAAPTPEPCGTCGGYKTVSTGTKEEHASATSRVGARFGLVPCPACQPPIPRREP